MSQELLGNTDTTTLGSGDFWAGLPGVEDP